MFIFKKLSDFNSLFRIAGDPTRARVTQIILVRGRPFIMYAPERDQDPIPSYTFPISVMLKKGVQGEGGLDLA